MTDANSPPLHSPDAHRGKLLDVPEFIRTCVERAGGAVEAGRPGSLDVLLPPGLESAAGGRSWARLSLAPGVEGEDCEPATLGSPFLDALIAFAAGRGTVGSGYLPAGRLKRRGLREEVQRTLRFANCRTRYEDNEAEVRLAATLQFDFKVAFLSEERRERLYVVPVNLLSNLVNTALAERLPAWDIGTEPPWPMPEAPSVSIEDAYATACGAVREMAGHDADRQQVRVERRFAVEFARISGYYRDVVTQLERRRDRELLRAGFESSPEPPGPNGAPGDDPPGRSARAVKADALSQKLEAARLERERKLRELGESYTIRTRVRLASARCLWQPKAFFKVLLDRGPVTRALVLAHDGLLDRLEPPSCEGCRKEATRLRASATAQLLCPACAGE